MTDAAAPRPRDTTGEPQATDLDHLDQGLIDRAPPDDLPPSPAEERRDLAERAEGQAADAAARDAATQGAATQGAAREAESADGTHDHDPIQAEVAALVTSGPFRAAGHAEDEPSAPMPAPMPASGEG